MNTHSSPQNPNSRSDGTGASRHVDRFNHDEDAAEYDDDVKRESDPIRAGYDDLLRWVAAQVQEPGDAPILELGSGTGNLTLRLPAKAEVTCVDTSTEMSRKLLDKLPPQRTSVRLEIDDVLAYVRRAPASAYRSVVSTYTLHHLEEDEKDALFAELRRILRPGGSFVVGDLMFENKEARARIVAEQRLAGDEELAEVIEDEFFWEIDRCLDALRVVGFEVSSPVPFSALSWGLMARRK